MSDMSTELRRLLEEAKGREVSAAERREQRISWAYGNIVLHNPSVTRQMVIDASDALDREKQ